MWNQLLRSLESVDFEPLRTFLLAFGGFFCSVVSTLMGEHQNLFYWLFGFVVADYLSGIFAAARTGTWSSRAGLKGVVRKFLILLTAIGFHGVDQILNEPWIGAWAIGALSLNELISILENVEKAGFGSLIPRRIRDMLDAVQKEQQQKIKTKLKEG
ncbi:phage holin family protein [uncultured Parasutterella sp.]|nr:phage holin family protein [uncultured Parasutterella sp.]